MLGGACGARTGFDVTTVAADASSEGPPGSTGACFGTPDAGASPQPSRCSLWQLAGTDTVISGPPAPGGTSYLTSVVPSGGGALATWFTASSADTATWDTRSVNLDGTPRSAVVSHLSFPTMNGVYVDVMSLAVNPQCAFGGLTDDVAAACRFVPLDGDGNETGPVVSLGGNAGAGCGALGPAPQGFSYLEEAPANSGTIDLVTIGTDGSFRLRTSLGALPGYGTRLVLGDETFLLASFFENDAGGDLTEEVAHYDARGIQITPGATVTTTSGSILYMVETSAGVLSSYIGFDATATSGEAVYVVPLTRDGAPLAAPTALHLTGATGPVYGFSLDPTPGGDALLTWNELDANNHYQLFAIVLAPDGTPRGPPTALGTYEGVGNVHVVTGDDGAHALLLYSGEPVGGNGAGGVRALPLACTTH